MKLEAEKGDCLRSRLFSLEDACWRIDETMNAEWKPHIADRPELSPNSLLFRDLGFAPYVSR